MQEREWDLLKEDARKLVALLPIVKPYLQMNMDGNKNKAIEIYGNELTIYDFSKGVNELYNKLKPLHNNRGQGKMTYFGECDCKIVAFLLIITNSYSEYKIPLYLEPSDIIPEWQCEIYRTNLEKILDTECVEAEVCKWAKKNFVLLPDKEFLVKVIA